MKENSFPSHRFYSGIHLFNETKRSLPVTEKDAVQITHSFQQYEKCIFNWIEIAFIDRDKIVEINREYLNHHYSTDIITFRYDEESNNQAIEGTLYCCATRIEQQAKENSEALRKEFLRVIIHGLLHLCGYDDKTKELKEKMAKREDFYLSKLYSPQSE